MDLFAEKEKFINIVGAHKRIIYKVVSVYCKDADDRKDIEQEIMIQLWKSLKNYDDTYKLSTWIYKISLNVAISHFRKEKKRKGSTDTLDESIFLLSEEEFGTEKQGRLDFLNDFIQQLDSFNKAIILLYLEENSYKEISEILGITETNVGTKMGRIKKQLKEFYIETNNSSKIN
jgi:RNA polymerase sigma factor (sigma-70 family)